MGNANSAATKRGSKMQVHTITIVHVTDELVVDELQLSVSALSVADLVTKVCAAINVRCDEAGEVDDCYCDSAVMVASFKTGEQVADWLCDLFNDTVVTYCETTL